MDTRVSLRSPEYDEMMGRNPGPGGARAGTRPCLTRTPSRRPSWTKVGKTAL